MQEGRLCARTFSGTWQCACFPAHPNQQGMRARGGEELSNPWALQKILGPGAGNL